MDIPKHDMFSTLLSSSVKELQERINLHHHLIASILEGEVDETTLQSFFDLCPKRSREVVMEDAVKHTIDVLEETRKAFKSKKLEILRKDLTRVLIEA